MVLLFFYFSDNTDNPIFKNINIIIKKFRIGQYFIEFIYDKVMKFWKTDRTNLCKIKTNILSSLLTYKDCKT